MGKNDKFSDKETIGIVTSPTGFFSDLVNDALAKRRLEVQPLVSNYLVQLLETYLVSENLYQKGTLAEMYMRSFHVERQMRIEMLKKLGDSSLYIAGFFGDSLRRKIIDIDYYKDIGGSAYGSLAKTVEDEFQARVFNDFSTRFIDYVDVLTYISQSALIQSNQDLLRLYERYVTTGSELAKDQLVEKGLLTNIDKKKHSQ
jgi:Mor family transcriptional regulator